MSSSRSRFVKTGALAGALACSLVFALPGGAVTGGTAVLPAPSWTAYIVVKHGTSTSVCSGAFVGSKWILTAAQCVAGTAQSPCKFLTPYPALDFKVYLGRASNTIKGKAYAVASVSAHSNSSTSVDGQCVPKNDVALLQLSTATTMTPLSLAPSRSSSPGRPSRPARPCRIPADSFPATLPPDEESVPRSRC